MVRFRSISQSIQHNSGLHTGKSLLRIEFQNVVHVFAEVENYGDVAALPCEACAGAARQNWRAEFSARLHGRDHILLISRQHQTDRDLPIIRGIGGVERASAAVEADFSAHAMF